MGFWDVLGFIVERVYKVVLLLRLYILLRATDRRQWKAQADGDTQDPLDQPEAIGKVMNGSLWNEFCDSFKASGEVVMREHILRGPHPELDRIEGFRYLTRMLRGGLESYLEYSDPLFPELRKLPDLVKMGADNPDNYYQFATISGKCDYKIVGTRGTIHYLGMGAYEGPYPGKKQNGGRAGYLEDKQLVVDPSGAFEVILSCTRPDGAGDTVNWLPLTPEAEKLIVRQTYNDHKKEELAQLKLICTSKPDAMRPANLLAVELQRGLAGSAMLVNGAGHTFANWAEEWSKLPNELHTLSENVSTGAWADPNLLIYHGYWRIDQNEALAIRVSEIEADFFNFQLNNIWMESLDYRFYKVSVNGAEATMEDERTVKIFISYHKPSQAFAEEYGNRIESQGHLHGTMALRLARPRRDPVIEITKVQLF